MQRQNPATRGHLVHLRHRGCPGAWLPAARSRDSLELPCMMYYIELKLLALAAHVRAPERSSQS